MENIFTCKLHVHGDNVTYHVVFEDEKYVFKAETKGATVPEFKFAREENEWKDLDHIDHTLKQHAVNALEKYLLSQH